ncbi:FUSC family protein [Edaphobacter sp. DSM 109919]|uniref:FUSC family protein n=1 Tax=Edaphobacter paludis TaxID=3035702 RepID=A0AAU7CX10_9BACT
MATTNAIPVQPSEYVPPRIAWTRALLQDLQPTPGRVSSALRIVLASVIALVLMEALQMPFIALGMYFIFLIGRDSPAVSFRSSLYSCGVVIFAIAVEFAVVIVSDNDPVARLLSVAVVTFVAGMFVVATNYPALGSSFGLIYCTVISLWELHAPADRLVKSSLYLVGTFAISLGSAVAIEYIFGARHPAEKLQEQRRIRYVSLERLFRLYAEDAPPLERFHAATEVSRIAVAGSSQMMALYNTIVERNLDTGVLPLAMRLRITMLAQLMDVAAAFGLQNPAEIDTETRARCARLADELKRVVPGIPSAPGTGIQLGPGGHYSLLDRVEGALHAILTMPVDIGPVKHRELVALPSKDVPFFIPGALRSKQSIAFGLKISLCATFCYILYHALAWPGIATAVTTVLVTGLSSTGATKQKLAFRVLGSLIGGLLLGIGAIVFLFPYMDSITSLVVLEIVIAFLSAWVAAGPKFNYIGLQIAFSFYVVAFEGLRAPTGLAPARDRFIGVLIALAVMVLVFDQLWPVRTTTLMRSSFVSVLRLGADLFTAIDSGKPRPDILHQADILRDRLGKAVAGLRSMNGAVQYEFGAERSRHIETGDMILRSALTSAALLWNQLAVLHSAEDSHYLHEPGLRTMRATLADHMRMMADAIEHNSQIPIEPCCNFVDHALLDDPRYSDYARNTEARYDELQNFTAMLSLQK